MGRKDGQLIAEQMSVEAPGFLLTSSLALLLMSGEGWSCRLLLGSRGGREGTVAILSLIWGLKGEQRHHYYRIAMKWTHLRERGVTGESTSADFIEKSQGPCPVLICTLYSSSAIPLS